MYKIIMVFLFYMTCNHLVKAQQSKELTSPDGKLLFSFTLTKEGTLAYSINYQQKPIVLSSVLGLGDWEKGFVLTDSAVSRQDTIWKPVYGERSLIRDHYNEMIFSLMRKYNERQKIQLQVKAYNEGIAFRYNFPEDSLGGTDLSIQKEVTEFTMPEEAKAWGVKGIKFGFVHVGSQHWTTWMHEAVKKCAKYNLMVDIHDEYRPTGFSRTYPNPLTQEGVRGNEEMPEATNSTILPFTRYIAGAADHTICYYHQIGLKPNLTRHIKTTSGHQLALSVIFYSPLQFLYWYDKPSDVQDEPELEFFDKVPVVWDDTKVLQGEIGEHVTIARRSGDDWFVGSVTNTEARKLKLPFDFLEKNGKFKATIYSDDPGVNTRTHVGIRKKIVNSETVLNVDMNSSGGLAIHITPKVCQTDEI